MAVYIYGLKCPLANCIRYVGKSQAPTKRLIAHITHARTGYYKHHTSSWIRKLLRMGLQPELVILYEVRPSERWQDVERKFIADASLLGWKLTNSTAGGEGLDYIDPVAERKYRAKLSASMTELWNRPERRIEARERSLKAWADPEVTHRRVAALRATYATPAMKEKLSKTSADVGARPEVKAKRSASLKASWADGKRNAKRMASLSSIETRGKMSASAKARWADPEKGEAIRRIRSSAESRENYRKVARARSTPEYRAAAAERTRKSWEKRRKKQS